MSDLFGDLAGGLLDIALDRSDRRFQPPEPPPLPPGIPALPPDPRAIAQGLAAIRAHDPNFDEAMFLTETRALWHRETGATAGPAGPGDGLRDVCISAAKVGPQLETITVRFGTAAGESDWVFQRASGAVTPTGQAGEADHCPNCGAPIELTPTGECRYCHRSLLDAPGWSLVTRNLLRPMTERDAAVLAMVASSMTPDTDPTLIAPPPPPPAAGEGVDTAALGIDAYSLLATARETVYAVAQARSRRTPGAVSAQVGGELAAALSAEAASTAAAHHHHILAFLEVTDAVITAASRGADGDRVTVRMHVSGEEYEIADAGMQLVDGTQTMRTWTEDWGFLRAPGAGDWIAVSSVRVADGS